VKGFTLVELMVAFSIGMVVVIGGIVTANRFNADQKVDAAKSEIEEVIRSARNYAMTRQKPEGFGGILEYVAVTLDASGVAKVLPGNNTNGIYPTEQYLSKTIKVSETTVTAINEGDLIFSVPEGKLLDFVDINENVTRPSSVGGSLVVTIESVETGVTKTIIVSEFGAIK